MLDSMPVSLPNTRRHNCAKMNNKTVGGGVLWGLCVTAGRTRCPLQVLAIMEGAWHDSKVVRKVRFLAHGPLYLMDRGFYAFDLLHQWLTCGVRFIVRARGGKDLYWESVKELGGCRALRAKTSARGPGRRAVVLFDGVARLGVPTRRGPRPTVRLLIVQLVSGGKSEELALASSELSMDAQKLLDLYGRRWEIEEFHRVIKRTIGLAHLYSFRQRGIETLLGIAALLAMLLWLEENPLLKIEDRKRSTIAQMLREIIRKTRRTLGIPDPWKPNTIGRRRWRKRGRNH